MSPTDLTGETLVAVLSESGSRAAFVAALRDGRDGRDGRDLTLVNTFAAVAPRCVAAAEDLRRIAAVLLGEGLDDLLEWLVPHPAMPDDVLLLLCEAGRCVSALGHRGGPRWLLERVVERHGYAEAILSLGLDLYADDRVPLATFAAFVTRHQDCGWLLRTLAHGRPSSPEKEDAYLRVLEAVPEPHAVVAMASRIFGDPARTVATLGRFLRCHPGGDVLRAVVRSHRSDAETEALVLGACRRHPERARLRGDLAALRAAQRASSETLDAREAEALHAAGRPEVLLALAANVRTPTRILDALVALRGCTNARTLRARARETLDVQRRRR